MQEILIYGKKNAVLFGAFLLFGALLVLSVALTLGIAAYVGENPAKAAEEIFQPENTVYLFPAAAILGIPTLAVYLVLCIGERRFLCVYRTLPEAVKQKLFEVKFREQHQGRLRIYEADGYILFYDRCLFGTPQIVRTEDIVWGYLGRSDFRFSDMAENVVSANLRFFSLCFYTKGGERHRIFANVSYKEIVSWFTARCPQAILGYGREQKRRAEEIFRAEAEQAAFWFGEKRDTWLARRKRAVTAAVGGGLLIMVLLTAGFYGRRYLNSAEYLYQKNMRQAESCWAQGNFSGAYQAYYAARECREDDTEALKGMLLSSVEMAKTDGYLDGIIRNYENLFFYQELFADETDISGWYFECAEYYLMYEDPMGAADLLERGIEIFEDAKTVVETDGASGEPELEKEDILNRRKEIIGRMEQKKEDILTHCQIKSVTEYLCGKRNKYTEYDDAGREVVNVSYLNQKSRWEYKSYDEAGNVTFVETWEKKEEEEEKQKIREEYLEYDKQGNLYYDVKYDTARGEETYEMSCGYDQEGRQIYYQEVYDGEIFTERQCCLISDNMQIDKEYTADYPEGEDPIYYIAQKWDEKGNILEKSYYSLFYSPEDIQAGTAEALIRYDYTYDEKKNPVSLSYISGETGISYPVYEREYDDRDNLTKEIYYYGNDDVKNSAREITIWNYNDENLPVKKEISTVDEDSLRANHTEIYTYDEAGNLIRTDYYLDGDKIGFSILKEYNVLGNQVKEYRIEGSGETVPQNAEPDKEWEYRYRYGIEGFRGVS